VLKGSVAAAFFAAPSFAQDQEALKKDLTAVIALH
jgi:acetylornithine deacetylase/succinyl-diaminopimelate desuccinylase-like protein